MGLRVGAWRIAWVLVALLAGACTDGTRANTADGIPGVDPGTIDFGRRPLFEGEAREIRVTNVGRASLEIQRLEVVDEGRTYEAELLDPGPVMLLPGEARGARVRFLPRASGPLNGVLRIHTDSIIEPILEVPLTGEGVDVRATFTPERLDFGRIEVDSSTTRELTLENPGDLTTEVQLRLVGADAAEFSVEQTLALGPREQRTLTLNWAPKMVGKKQVALAVTRCRGCADEAVVLTAEALERAVIVEPNPLDFGPTPMDHDGMRTVRLVNLSTEPQEVRSMALSGDTNPGFTHSDPGLPVTLAPGAHHEVTFRFSPGHLGAAQGRADFVPVSPRHDTLPLTLRGFGGAPELCVGPYELDFGEQPVGHKPTLTVNLKNCGTQNADPITVTSAVVTGMSGGSPEPFGLIATPLPVTLAAGEEVNLTVFYEPTSIGAHSGTLTLTSDAESAAEVYVALRGSARATAPCSLQVRPEALDFGTVLPGWGAALVVRFHNEGADVCPVKNLALTDDGDGNFILPGGPLAGILMGPGESFSVMVAFRAPESGGDFTGALGFEIVHPDAPARTVPLTAHAEESCLVAAPNFLDFGVTRPDCPVPPRSVSFANQCTSPILVTDATIGPGTSDDFSLTVPLPGPTTLAPGDTLTLEAAYAGQLPGLQGSPLFVASDALTVPLLVPLLGESTTRSEVVDRFVQTDGAKVDVLFVVDNTGSMVEEQPRLAAAMPAFASAALSRGTDLRVGVTTSGIDPVSDACPGGAQGGEGGRLFPVDGSGPRLMTSATPDLGAALANNVRVGLCATVEQSFEAARRALSRPLITQADDPRTPIPNDGNLGLLREEASLALVFVGDEDDHSPDGVETYVQFFQSLKGSGQPGRVQIHAIAPEEGGCETAGGTGARYAAAAAMTGGSLLSVCAEDYAPLLSAIAASSMGPQSRFPLSAQPDPATLVVTLDGAPVTAGWHWDVAGNAVVFDVEPPPGARIELTYTRVCG